MSELGKFYGFKTAEELTEKKEFLEQWYITETSVEEGMEYPYKVTVIGYKNID